MYMAEEHGWMVTENDIQTYVCAEKEVYIFRDFARSKC